MPTSIHALRSLDHTPERDLGAALNLDDLLMPDLSAMSGPVLPVNAYGQAVESGPVRALAQSVQTPPVALSERGTRPRFDRRAHGAPR